MKACMNSSVCVGSVRPPAINIIMLCATERNQHGEIFRRERKETYVQSVQHGHDEEVALGELRNVFLNEILQQGTRQHESVSFVVSGGRILTGCEDL